MFRNILLMALVAGLAGGCCAVTCNSGLPNSHIKVSSVTPADCSFEDKAGVREFKAPGTVLGMPRNAPGTLICTAKGYKPYSRTVSAQDWSPLTSLSGNADSLRYYVEIDMVMEQEK